MMKIRIVHFLFLLGICSCTLQEVCDNDNQTIMVARFKTTRTGVVTDTLLQEFTLYGIREGKVDSLLYDSAAVSRIELPLDPAHDRSVFVMSAGGKTDTLTLMHAGEAYLISYTCGFAARFKLEEILHSGGMILDTEIISASVDAETLPDEEHLWIYY